MTVHAQPRYFHLEGTVGKSPVVVDLFRDGKYATGTYYYSKVGQPILVGHSAADFGEGDTLVLTESVRGDTSSELSSLRLLQSGADFIGLWRSGNGKRTAPVELHESYRAGSIRFTPFTLIDSGSTKIRPTIPATATATYTVELPDKTTPQGPANFISRQIAKMLECGNGTTPESCMRSTARAYVDTTVREFHDTYDDMADSDLAMGGYEQYNYYEDHQVHVLYNDIDVVVLSHEAAGYSGGAHGYYGIGMHVLDIAGKRELKLEDITTADSATLQNLVEKYFREQYHLKKGAKLSEILFDDHLWASDNFYITDKGIGFMYNPYEAASWAQGVIEVFVPFSAMKGKLTPWVTQRMKL